MQLSNERLAELIQQGIFAREHLETLYNQNKSLMIAIINRTLQGGQGKELTQELMQELYITLCECVKGYDSKSGTKFSTYFSRAIQCRIYTYTAENRTVKLSSAMLSKLSRYKKLCKAGYSDSYIADMLNVDTTELDSIKMCSSSVLSLDEPVGGAADEKITRADTIAADSSVFDDIDRQIDDKIFYNRVKRTLPPRLFEVVKLKYWYNYSTSSIAIKLCIKADKVREMERQALDRLRRSKYIEAYAADYYRHIGVNEFRRTHTSVTEKIAIERAELTELLNSLRQ